MTLNKELFFMPTLFNMPSRSTSSSPLNFNVSSNSKPLGDEHTKSDLGPMSHKLAKMCSENNMTSRGDASKKPLLCGFDETQSKLLGTSMDHSSPSKQQNDSETSYQSLISQLVDKVTKDMYGKSEKSDANKRDQEVEGKTEDSEQETEFLFDSAGNKQRGKVPRSLLAYVSDSNASSAFTLKEETTIKGEHSQQSSAFKGASDSIEILRKLKHKVLKKSPTREVSSPTKSMKTKATTRVRSTSKNDVNASLMCSPFHAAQERERRKHMMVMISLVRYHSNTVFTVYYHFYTI